MGRYVAKQPNGKYCVFSTIVDTIVAENLTEYEVIEFFVEEEKEIIEERAKRLIEKCKDFSEVREDFYPANETQGTFDDWCRSVGWVDN